MSNVSAEAHAAADKYNWIFVQCKAVVNEARLKCNSNDILVFAWVFADGLAHCVARERTDAVAKLKTVYVEDGYADVWHVAEKPPSNPNQIVLILATTEGLHVFRYEYTDGKDIRVLS